MDTKDSLVSFFLRHSAIIFVLAAMVYSTFLASLVKHADGDISKFIHIGDYFVDEEKIDSSLSILPNSYGHDGQFYYRLALDPFTTKQSDYGITIDYPPGASSGLYIRFWRGFYHSEINS